MNKKIQEKVLKEVLKHERTPMEFFKWAYDIKEIHNKDLEYDLGLLIQRTCELMEEEKHKLCMLCKGSQGETIIICGICVDEQRHKKDAERKKAVEDFRKEIHLYFKAVDDDIAERVYPQSINEIIDELFKKMEVKG